MAKKRRRVNPKRVLVAAPILAGECPECKKHLEVGDYGYEFAIGAPLFCSLHCAIKSTDAEARKLEKEKKR